VSARSSTAATTFSSVAAAQIGARGCRGASEVTSRAGTPGHCLPDIQIDPKQDQRPEEDRQAQPGAAILVGIASPSSQSSRPDGSCGPWLALQLRGAESASRSRPLTHLLFWRWPLAVQEGTRYVQAGAPNTTRVRNGVRRGLIQKLGVRLEKEPEGSVALMGATTPTDCVWSIPVIAETSEPPPTKGTVDPSAKVQHTAPPVHESSPHSLNRNPSRSSSRGGLKARSSPLTAHDDRQTSI
jgi:hypothetical protein